MGLEWGIYVGEKWGKEEVKVDEEEDVFGFRGEMN